MKALFFAIVSVASLSAGADPFSFRGIYAFRGNVSVIGRQTVDIVDVRMPESAARMDEIRRTGGACQRVSSSTFRCVTLSPADAVPASSVAQLRLRNRGVAIAFGDMTGTPSVVTRAPSLTEWSIPQRGRSRLGDFAQYRYLELTGGLSKLVLPGSPEPLWLNTTDGKTLRQYDSLSTTESRWRFHVDSVELILER